jgi:hypothetical protein
MTGVLMSEDGDNHLRRTLFADANVNIYFGTLT